MISPPMRLPCRKSPAELRLQVGDGAPAGESPIAVLAPEPGWAPADWFPAPSGWIAVAGEGGNVTLAATDSREAAIIDILRRQYAHVSAEMVLSGPGLVNFYECLCELAGKPATPSTPEHVTNLYPGCDPQCREAVALFCAMLGSFAGDLALTFGARGGVYVMGGIVPKIYEIFRHSPFRERFEFKGRYRALSCPGYPTYVVAHPYPGVSRIEDLVQGLSDERRDGKLSRADGGFCALAASLLCADFARDCRVRIRRPGPSQLIIPAAKAASTISPGGWSQGIWAGSCRAIAGTASRQRRKRWGCAGQSLRDVACRRAIGRSR